MRRPETSQRVPARRRMPVAAPCDPPETVGARLASRIVAVHDQLAGLADLRPGPEVDALFRELVEVALSGSWVDTLPAVPSGVEPSGVEPPGVESPGVELPGFEAFRTERSPWPASSGRLADSVLADPTVADLLPSLVGLCGQAEYQLELAWAGRIAGSAAPRQVLDAFPYLANYHELSRLEHQLVVATGRSIRRVAFVGSGPLPLTGMLLSQSFGVPVDNIDRDPAAVVLARRVGSALGAAVLCRFHERDLFDCPDLDRYDLVVLAALVGLDPADKERALAHLAATMRPGALLLARSAHGLRRLLYPVVEVGEVPGLDLLSVVHPPAPVINSVVIARRSPAG